MPWSKVAKGAALGVAGGVATGIAGPSLINNTISTAGGMIGYYVAGETGAVIGSLAGSISSGGALAQCRGFGTCYRKGVGTPDRRPICSWDPPLQRHGPP